MTAPLRLFLIATGLLGLATLALGLAASVQGGAVTTVRVDPAIQTVSEGGTAVAEIRVDNVGASDEDGLGAFEFTLSFDPDVLAFSDLTYGTFLGSTGRDVNCLPVQDEDVNGDTVPDPGFVRFGCTSFGPEPPGPTGSGIVATVDFLVVSCGTSDIDFDVPEGSAHEPIELADPLGNAIDAQKTPGVVACAGLGDVNCDDIVNAIDALLILQLDAALLSSLPCQENADVNVSGGINALDALLVLQFDAGLLLTLPP